MNGGSGKQRVLVIGLDAADRELIELWCGQGLLPNLSQMRADGAWGDLNTTADGFLDFHTKLIGDYNPDAEVEDQPDLICPGCESAFYLDDIAHYMQTNDFRPDYDGDQVIDTYTIGFATGPTANALLQKTADVGNGLFLAANSEDELAQGIIDALTDVIEKSQSFTAATVPASRTTADEYLYASVFLPSSKSPYWTGHLRAYEFTPDGEIHDRNGDCAVIDPVPGECFDGPFFTTAERPPFWDAGEEIPSPPTRDLWVSRLSGGVPGAAAFRHTTDTPAGPLAAADLGVVYPPSVPYTGSLALDAEQLTAEIIANVRGCEFGTGANGVPCTPRPWLLSDIFHSSPVLVGSPALYDTQPSYQAFSAARGHRDRVIYAGSNGGFLHGFHAGEWDPATVPPGYDGGTGRELFGFMPWLSRTQVKDLPNDTGSRDFYFVDGAISVADAWLYTNPTTAAKLANGSEWRTVLVGGLRQGGATYYALDISDPDAASCAAPATGSGYPCYLWEFPNETAPAAWSDYVGETWGDPIFTKIRVKVGADDNGGAGYERHVAVVTGGYHASGDPNDAAYDPTATEGRSIWILDVKTGEPIAAKRFDALGDCSDLDQETDANYDPLQPERDMCAAIPSAPAVYDLDFDGYADLILVGDLAGNLWKWVIDDIGEDRVNDGSGSLSQPSWPFRKFFRAPDYKDEHFKSFFYPPAATKKSGKLWIAIGSGERANLLFEGELAKPEDDNRFYAILDPDPYDALDPDLPVVTEADLLNVTANESCADVSAYQGYLFIGENGEKFVTNVDIFSYFVVAGSYLPGEALDPCAISGEARLYAFRVYCGEGFFTDGAGNPERSLTIGAGMPADPRVTITSDGGSQNRVVINKQGGDVENIEAPPIQGDGIGVFYWRELP
jgi:type IV pilus assembly protein PilY1